MTHLQTPVLFLIFNRPDTTKLVFERIREAKPQRLYIAADGPRSGREGEVELCLQSRSVVELIDWACEVKTLFREENLGCARAVSSAIDWFFDHEESGIILEDDCLPDLTFFPYCGELLKLYEGNERIGMISGNQFIDASDLKTSYYFSYFPHIWGWATWKRVWQNFDLNMKDWPTIRQTRLLREKTGSTYYADKWKSIFDRVFEGKIDTWDYPFVYTLWVMNQLSISPKQNLVTNIGFGLNATHTNNPKDIDKYYIDARKVLFPLSHPKRLLRNSSKDMAYLKFYYGSRKHLIVKIYKYLLASARRTKNRLSK